MDVASGAGEAGSDGFLDVLDVTPWDTWLLVIEGKEDILLSWVPPQFLLLTGRGVVACEVSCGGWADRPPGWHENPDISAALQEMGLAAPANSVGDISEDPDADWRKIGGL